MKEEDDGFCGGLFGDESEGPVILPANLPLLRQVITYLLLSLFTSLLSFIVYRLLSIVFLLLVGLKLY